MQSGSYLNFSNFSLDKGFIEIKIKIHSPHSSGVTRFANLDLWIFWPSTLPDLSRSVRLHGDCQWTDIYREMFDWLHVRVLPGLLNDLGCMLTVIVLLEWEALAHSEVLDGCIVELFNIQLYPNSEQPPFSNCWKIPRSFFFFFERTQNWNSVKSDLNKSLPQISHFILHYVRTLHWNFTFSLTFTLVLFQRCWRQWILLLQMNEWCSEPVRKRKTK